MKKTLIINALVTILMFLGGIYLLSNHIYNRKDCERFNIDNIEMRAKINIPTILSSDCSCNKNIKTSLFKIDTNNVDIKQYIIDNQFELANNMYSKKGDNSDTRWEASLNHKTADLLIKITYKN